ncbi:MAG: hypothetical protein EPN20_07695 [Magnetospirillum sp.]|nr:MAG: hypothetical protein EPN20_07695 [Magnetospirillum sp.]
MTLQTDLEAAVAKVTADSNTLHAIVHGPASGMGSAVTTGGGDVKTVAKAIADVSAVFAEPSAISLSVGIGSKVFTVTAGLPFAVGQFVTAASASDPDSRMWGEVIGYAGTSLTVNVQATGGSGTHADWVVSLSGARGPEGAQGPQGPQGSPGAGSGDVVGPAGATANAIAMFDGVTGKLLKDGGCTVTVTGAALIAAANAVAVRSLLALVPGTDVQACHANLAALTGLAGGVDKLAYFSGTDAMALATLSAFGRSLIDDADAAAARATLGIAALGIPDWEHVAGSAINVSSGSSFGWNSTCVDGNTYDYKIVYTGLSKTQYSGTDGLLYLKPNNATPSNLRCDYNDSAAGSWSSSSTNLYVGGRVGGGTTWNYCGGEIELFGCDKYFTNGRFFNSCSFNRGGVQFGHFSYMGVALTSLYVSLSSDSFINGTARLYRRARP